MDWPEYLEDRKIKMQAIAAARAKRAPIQQADQQSVEFARITEALETTGGDIESAAELIEMSRAGLYRRVKSLNIDLTSFRKQKQEL